MENLEERTLQKMAISEIENLFWSPASTGKWLGVEGVLTRAGQLPWDFFSKNELNRLLRQDDANAFLKAVLNMARLEIQKNQVDIQTIQRNILYVLNIAFDTDSPDEYRNQAFGALADTLPWKILPEEYLISVAERLLLEDGSDETARILLQQTEIAGAAFRLHRHTLRIKFFNLLGRDILEKDREGGGISDILYAGEKIFPPLSEYDGEFFNSLLRRLAELDNTGEYLAYHLKWTDRDVYKGREKLYSDLARQFIKADPSGTWALFLYGKDTENDRIEDGRKLLFELPQISGLFFEHLATIKENKDYVLEEVASSGRLPREQRERFLSMALSDGRWRDGESAYCPLLGILCFQWEKGNSNREAAERIIQEQKRRGEVNLSSLFSQCIMDKTFTDGDFFLETLLSIFEGGSLSSPAQFSPVPEAEFGILELLIQSLHGTVQHEKTLKLHEELLNGPLLNFLGRNSGLDKYEEAERKTEKQKTCGSLKKEYLRCLGILGLDNLQDNNMETSMDCMVI